MKASQTWVISLTAIAILGVLLLIGLSHGPSVIQTSMDSAAQFKRENRYALDSVCKCLLMASLDKPHGGECKSLPEAVKYVMNLQHDLPTFWQCKHTPQRTNGFVHLNPEWDKWREAALDERAHAKEIAAFCDDPLVAQVTKQPEFTAMTFDLSIVEITNAPVWPRATELLK